MEKWQLTVGEGGVAPPKEEVTARRHGCGGVSTAEVAKCYMHTTKMIFDELICLVVKVIRKKKVWRTPSLVAKFIYSEPCLADFLSEGTQAIDNGDQAKKSWHIFWSSGVGCVRSTVNSRLAQFTIVTDVTVFF